MWREWSSSSADVAILGGHAQHHRIGLATSRRPLEGLPSGQSAMRLWSFSLISAVRLAPEKNELILLAVRLVDALQLSRHRPRHKPCPYRTSRSQFPLREEPWPATALDAAYYSRIIFINSSGLRYALRYLSARSERTPAAETPPAGAPLPAQHSAQGASSKRLSSAPRRQATAGRVVSQREGVQRDRAGAPAGKLYM